MDRVQHAHVIQLARRNFRRGENHRPFEKIALKIDESHVAGGEKVFPIFNFFRQHANPWPVAGGHRLPLIPWREDDVELNEVSYRNQ